MVSAADPCSAVRGRLQGFDFWVRQIGEECALESLLRNGKDSLDDGGAGGLVQGGVAEERVQGSETGIACARAIASLMLQVIEERADERNVEVLQGDGGGWLGETLLHEGQQQAESVAVRGYRVSAGVSLQ
jgi:hypothetical protein